MGDIEDQDFEEVGAGASETYPQQCSALRKNGYVMIKDRPCKIVEMSTSKTGKHGHAKVHMVGIDIFTGKKLEDICPSTHNMNVPHVKRTDFQFTHLDDDESYVNVIDNDGNEFQFKVEPGDVLTDIKTKDSNGDDFLVTIMEAVGSSIAVGTKPMTKWESKDLGPFYYRYYSTIDSKFILNKKLRTNANGEIFILNQPAWETCR